MEVTELQNNEVLKIIFWKETNLYQFYSCLPISKNQRIEADNVHQKLIAAFASTNTC